MSNETRHYFGAYFEIKTERIERISLYLGCKNGHRDYSKGNAFCPKCGEKTGSHKEVSMVYPTCIVDHLLGEEYEDILAVITPYSLFGSGTILAISNSIECNSEWLSLDRWGGEIATKPFPTQEEIERMKAELETSYAEIVGALRRSSAVQSVIVKAGYVIDEEY